MRADQDIVHHAEIAEDAAELERARDAIACKLLRRKAGDDLPVKTDLACIGQDQAGNEIEQGGLAGTVRPDDADQFASGEIEIDPSTAINPPNRRVSPRSVSKVRELPPRAAAAFMSRAIRWFPTGLAA